MGNTPDFGDWFSNNGAGNPASSAHVQDANNKAGVYDTLNVELRRLDVLGYTRVATAAPVVTAPANQTAVESASATLNLGSFTAASPNAPWGVTVNWGDSTTSPFFFLNSAGSLGTLTHTYAEEGTYTVTVKVTDFVSMSDSKTFTVNVSDAALTGSSAATATGGVEGVTAATLSNATFTDANTGAPSTDFTVTAANWGDSSTSTAGLTVTGSGGSYTVHGSHLYAEEGTYNFSFTVTDDGGKTATITGSTTVFDPAVVQDGPVAVSADEGAAFTGKAVAKFTDPGGAEPNPSDNVDGIPSHYKVVSIDWGDSTPLDTTSGSIVYNGVPLDGSKTNTFTVSGSHTYGEEGTYTIKVIIDHEGQRTTLTTTGVKVNELAVKASGVDVTGKECIAFNPTVATFTDPGGAEPNPSDNIDGIPSHYKATVDFGDGKGPQAATITYNGVLGDGSKTNTFTVTAIHTFDEEGTFTVTTTIDHEGVKTTVTSKATIRDNFGLLLLDTSGDKSLMVTGNGSVTVTNCGAVVVDSSSSSAIFLTGQAVVTATEADVGIGGDATIHGQAVLNLLEPEFNHEAATPDPFALGLPTAPATVSTTAVHISSGSVTLSPGTYIGGIAIDGTAAVTLSPGIYYMQGGGFSVSGQASVTDNGKGVLIVNAPSGSSGTISLDGQASVDLTAISGLTDGLASYNHFVIFQDPASANPVQITGQASLTVKGIVYAPNALFKVDGNGTATVSTDTNPTGGIVVALDAMITGNGALTINADPPDFAVPGADAAGSAPVRASAATVLAAPSSAARPVQATAPVAGNTDFVSVSPSVAARATQPIAPVVGDTDFASVQVSLAQNGPAVPASVIVIGNLSPNGPGVLVATTKVSPAPAPAAFSISANLSGGGDTGEDGMPDAPAVPDDPQLAPMAPATPLPDGETFDVLRLQARDAFFAASHWAPATSGRLNADVALPPAALGSAGDASPALVASEGAEQTPSLLAVASLALGLGGWWGAPRRREQKLHRRPVLK
jgi:PKD repeat protein